MQVKTSIAMFYCLIRSQRPFGTF